MIQHESVPPVYISDRLQIKLHVDSQHTHYGAPYSSPATVEMMAQFSAAQYRQEVLYINNTYQPITVMSRNGLAIMVPYTSSCSCRDFIIRKIIHLKGDALSTAIRSIQEQEQIDDAELQEIKKCLSNINSTSYSGASIMLDYIVTIEDLKAKGNTIYHYQTDLVISFKDTVNIEHHPYSTRFLNVGTFGITNTYADQKEMNLKIRYVNHSQNAAPVYINMLGKVFCIPPQKDAPARRILVKNLSGKQIEKVFSDYIQIFFSANNDPSVVSLNGVIPIRMTLEEAKEKIGLYDTYSEALNSGNIDAVRKEELLRLSHQLELLKQKNQIDKTRTDAETSKLNLDLSKMKIDLDLEVLKQKKIQTELDIQLQNIENEKKQLEIQRKEQEDRINRENRWFEERLRTTREENENKLKMEQMHWKEYYEARSVNRKDTVDFLKFIPGIIIAVGGITAVYLKMTAAKPA